MSCWASVQCHYLKLLITPPLISIFLLWNPRPILAQVNTGEVHLKVTDSDGLGLKASIVVSSEENQYRAEFVTDEGGLVRLKRLGYGRYVVSTHAPGCATISQIVEVRSAMPVEVMIKIGVATVNTVVKVKETSPLMDPSRPSSVMQIGSQQLETRVASLPGRSVQDLVDSQPGWIYEGNAVLHPRGSEYQTQFVIDGIPLTDNRSPSFGPEIEADDVESMNIYTAGFSAEYGRKMGGVIEINTKHESDSGLHGQLILSGGSYDTAQSFGTVQSMWGKNALSATASGSMTNHYLNPVVPENFTNKGTTGDFSIKYERDVTPNDRLSIDVRREFSRFQIPNESVQQLAGQRQNGDNVETVGSFNYQHILSSNVLANLRAMVREDANDLSSNPFSTPVIAFKHNTNREAYFKGAATFHQRSQEWKVGVESDASFLHENFSYSITDPTQFDVGTQSSLTFKQSRPDLEQAAFVQDIVRLGQCTVNAGVRWDHYQLLLNQNAFSPRVSVGRFVQSANAVLHFSYDRVFQSASNENILLSSSPQITSVSPLVLRMPVKPSLGNYYEGGITKSFSDRLRIDVNIFRRDVRNYGDDDQLLNTGVSYPIAFDRSVIYGAEGKLTLVRLSKLTGFVSYSYSVGNAWYPVTGGLFLGDDVTQALARQGGHFPVSQDQRNTVRTRFQYCVAAKLWVAAGLNSGSGLPFQFTGKYEDALAQYGEKVIGRVNFSRGRVDPSLSVNASLGIDLYKHEKRNVRMQVDGNNLNNRLNLIDFGGLFSGNAIAPGRSYAFRLDTHF